MMAAPPATAVAGTQVAFDLGGMYGTSDHFFDAPYPSDLRLVNGKPDVAGWPTNGSPLAQGLIAVAGDRPGFPVVAGGYFRFNAALPALDADTLIAADKGSPVLLIDVDPSSPARGTLYPTVAATPPPDGYTDANLLAVSPRPGIILLPRRQYAFLVMRSLNDAAGAPLGVPAALEQLKAGQTPDGALGAQAAALYAPLWATLKTAGIDPEAVAAATVFTTGDVVQDTADLSDKVLAQYSVTITDLHVEPNGGATNPRFCEVRGTVTYPQFQQGTPPYDTQGTFDFSGGDVPTKQRDEAAPVTFTLPLAAMPAGGYPLTVFFHGSGGLSTAIADRGPWHPETDPTKCPDGTLDTWNNVTGCNTKGEGPGYVLAPFGIAMAASALPLNPERLPGAMELEYLNLNNLAAFRDVFRQGILEQRMFIRALQTVTIPPDVVSACQGLSLPAGETAYRFNTTPLLAQGQSMGGMYTNLVSAVEPLVKAAVPTGAGGYWSYFVTKSSVLPNLSGKVALVLDTKVKLSFLHPALQLLETAWEPAEPMVYMPRLARRPLAGHPVRPIYEPAGQGDSYFPTEIYDAASLAYGHKEVGDVVWQTMQDALKLESLDGVAPYPTTQDLTSSDGASQYTGVIVQYMGDGIYDPHAIYSQLDAVKYQYGCFFSTFLTRGVATVPAPAPLGTPCP
jgi:hypothetical protein